MFENQYLVTDRVLNRSQELRRVAFGDLNIYHSPVLAVTTADHGDREVAVLGFIVDPMSPARTDREIAASLAARCATKEDLFRELQGLSGRYVLLYRNRLDFIALSDACALRQLYYQKIGGGLVLTSSPKMFVELCGGGLQTSESKRALVALKEFLGNDHEWYGDQSLDDRLWKILPNHYCDLRTKSAGRVPIDLRLLVGEKDIVDYAAAVLRGNIAAVVRRFHVIQPITAGWDSRTLLAAARDHVKDIEFYVIDFSTGKEKLPDVWVPERLTRALGIPFRVVRLPGASAEFTERFDREHLLPRHTYLAEVEYLHNTYHGTRTVRVNGIAGATIKAVYGYTSRHIDPSRLHLFTYYRGRSQFIVEEIARWERDAAGFAAEYGIPILDLFHWEQKVGNWGALTVNELDIAVENFCPHANRNLLASFLRIRPSVRAKPECRLLRAMVARTWPEALSEPVNPSGMVKTLRKKLRSHAYLKYIELLLETRTVR